MKKGIFSILYFTEFVLFFVFRKNINIDYLSIIPIFLSVLMLIQNLMFNVNMHRTFGETNYANTNAVRLTDEELEKQYQYLKYSFYFMLPFVVPFIFFFVSYTKLFSIIPYVLSYICGGFLFKMKYGRTIKRRIEIEKEELKKQMLNEELGKIK